MSIQDVANKVFKQYARESGPGENMEGLADSIARWTNFDYADSLKALNKSRIIFSKKSRGFGSSVNYN